MGNIQKDWPWRTIWKTIAPLEATCFIWIATPEACSVQQPADVLCDSAHELLNGKGSGCIKLALSSWNEQLHKGTMNTMQLLFLPSFSGLFGWRGIVDISMTREARKKVTAILLSDDHGLPFDQMCLPGIKLPCQIYLPRISIDSLELLLAPRGMPRKIIVRGRASKAVGNVMTEEVDMIGLVSIGDIVCAVVSGHRDELSR
ncbi:hypothetical protein MTR67_025673 [Solanum verrucosum]|uniref:Uncharacterized protein n=1 Tax=Solanum verrucosum TaxID=315347 RepID=A0AAF0TZG7_SOLVR|nr:hypothetical protein MTR67_025673 [Solanum verrucosum]